MRTAFWVSLVLILLINTPMTLAGPEIPDLKGTWMGDFTIVRTAPPVDVGPVFET